jgi:hypothetical protein
MYIVQFCRNSFFSSCSRYKRFVYETFSHKKNLSLQVMKNAVDGFSRGGNELFVHFWLQTRAQTDTQNNETIFGLSVSSPLSPPPPPPHTGLICVKTPEPNISCLGPFNLHHSHRRTEYTITFCISVSNPHWEME